MHEWIRFLREVLETLRSGGFPDLGIWSYVLLALLAATEGPFSVLLGAAAAAGGYLRADWVYLAAVIGNLAGDCAWYWVGLAGKPARIVRFGRWLGVHPEHVGRLEVAIRAHAVKLILLAKLSISLMIPTLIAAGMARVPWRRWFPVVFVLELAWIGLLVFIGYHATGAIARFEHSLQIVGVIALLLAVGGVVRYGRRVIRRAEVQNTPVEMAKRTSPASVEHPLSSPAKSARNVHRHRTPCVLEKEPVRVVGDPEA